MKQVTLSKEVNMYHPNCLFEEVATKLGFYEDTNLIRVNRNLVYVSKDAYEAIKQQCIAGIEKEAAEVRVNPEEGSPIFLALLEKYGVETFFEVEVEELMPEIAETIVDTDTEYVVLVEDRAFSVELQ